MTLIIIGVIGVGILLIYAAVKGDRTPVQIVREALTGGE